LFHFHLPNSSAAALSFQAAVEVAKKNPAVLQDAEAACALKNAKDNLRLCGVGAGGAPPLSTIGRMVDTARNARDWPGVLRWESRLEELLKLPEEGHLLGRGTLS
jgi:hypothetical protein